MNGPKWLKTARARDSDWAAPPLWRSEFRNVLVQHVRRGVLTPEYAQSTWNKAPALFRHETDPDPVDVLDTAFARELSAYDAEFVALAEALGVPLVTDDQRVLRACPNVAVSIDDFAEGEADTGGR